MTLLDLIVRWLRCRGATVAAVPAGLQVELALGDHLEEQLGRWFLLTEATPESLATPGTEPVYPGSRIADLCARETQDVRGIAVVAGRTTSECSELICVFSFLAVYQWVERSERLLRFALTADGVETAIPAEPDPSELSGGDGDDWRDRVRALFPVAGRVARERALEAGRPIEREAQRQLYVAARRQTNAYDRLGEAAEDRAGLEAQRQQRLADEIDRHGLRIRVSFLGATVFLDRPADG